MFEFTGLMILHGDMMKKGEERAVFPFEYNKKNFSCIFLVDVTPFRLYLTTLGAEPEVFELEIEKGYKVKGYMDDYKKLIACLELIYDPNHIFKPNDFFEALNKKIPKEFKQRPNYSEVIKIAAKKRNIEEANKVYFCGWKINSAGKNVTDKNFEKTQSAFGKEKAIFSRSKNISSRWTERSNEEDIKKLNEIFAT